MLFFVVVCSSFSYSRRYSEDSCRRDVHGRDDEFERKKKEKVKGEGK